MYITVSALTVARCSLGVTVSGILLLLVTLVLAPICSKHELGGTRYSRGLQVGIVQFCKIGYDEIDSDVGKGTVIPLVGASSDYVRAFGDVYERHAVHARYTTYIQW